jgi:hypothetical protein
MPVWKSTLEPRFSHLFSHLVRCPPRQLPAAQCGIESCIFNDSASAAFALPQHRLRGAIG